MRWGDLICQTGGLLSVPECEQLAAWAAQASPGIAVEVGHYTGLSTCVLLASLPAGTPLVTIDWHRWRDIPVGLFEQNVAPFVADREFTALYDDYEAALPTVEKPIGFVFYDGPHSPAKCDLFWRCVVDKLAEHAVIAFDDADWDSMDALRRHAADAGFETRTGPLQRYVLPYTTGNAQVDLDIAKRHPDTLTVEVLAR